MTQSPRIDCFTSLLDMKNLYIPFICSIHSILSIISLTFSALHTLLQLDQLAHIIRLGLILLIRPLAENIRQPINRRRQQRDRRLERRPVRRPRVRARWDEHLRALERPRQLVALLPGERVVELHHFVGFFGL